MSTTSYSIEESPKAKCVRVKVSLYDGRVVVVVPQGFDRGQIPDILREKHSWIERARRKVDEQRELGGTNGSADLPDSIVLRAVDEEWAVRYEESSAVGASVHEQSREALLVRGAVGNPEMCRAALHRWVRRKARSHLLPWLEQVSREQGLPMARVIVRSQRARWGSCSRRRTLSINQKLLFVPRALVHYVFLHELCHTAHFNHSREFWAFLTRREPKCRALDAELSTAWRYVPLWAYRSR